MPIRMILAASCVLASPGWWVSSVASADALELLRAEDDAPKVSIDDSPSPAAESFGAMGSRSWWLGGLAGAEFGINRLAGARGGIDWFVATDFSLGLQGDLGWASTVGESGGLFVGVAPILRWHFLNRERWTVFAEVGVGLAWTTVRIPEGGSRLNFTPQAAVGFTRDLGDDWRLRGTLGWFHMSNARTSNNNPGLDALAITIGIGRSF